ncbi:MAG: DUF1641 domain-containing protein [Acidobacteriota bacterium]|nr:DUF1641 domain-containing protein [Acidobacteriota bacterium]
MANPIAFKPIPVDPRTELTRRLTAAPTEHAEALLVLWDLLQSAHDEGLLDLAHGMISAKDTVAGKLAEYAKLPEGVAGIRNALALLKILSAVDPDALGALSSALSAAAAEHARESKPPSLYALFRRATGEDSRRALSFVTLLLSGAGRSLKRSLAILGSLRAAAASAPSAPSPPAMVK